MKTPLLRWPRNDIVNIGGQDSRQNRSRGTVMSSKFAGALAVALIGIVLAGAAYAQPFPSRPVTLIVPWPAGGTTDIGMRALATATEKHLGQPIVIENRPGGSGTLAPGQMAA